MSIYYRVVERKNLRDLESSGKYYASAASIGSMGLNELDSRVAIRSGHSQATVAGILYDLCEAIVYFIGQGRNVGLGNFGIIQLPCTTRAEAIPKRDTALLHSLLIVYLIVGCLLGGKSGNVLNLFGGQSQRFQVAGDGFVLFVLTFSTFFFSHSTRSPVPEYFRAGIPDRATARSCESLPHSEIPG